MSKDPAFLFYPSDWSSGTMLMTREQKGAYIDLLMCQFHHGHMTLHDVGQVLGQNDFVNMWEGKLKSKFKTDSEGNFFNERLEIEQLKRKKWCNSRRNNKEGKNQYSGHMTSHMNGHMVNVNKDVNRNEDTIRKEKLFNSIWDKYPNKDGKKQAYKHFLSSVNTEENWKDINKALDNYLESERVSKGYIKNGSTWFNNWQDWINIEKEEGVEL